MTLSAIHLSHKVASVGWRIDDLLGNSTAQANVICGLQRPISKWPENKWKLETLMEHLRLPTESSSLKKCSKGEVLTFELISITTDWRMRRLYTSHVCQKLITILNFSSHLAWCSQQLLNMRKQLLADEVRQSQSQLRPNCVDFDWIQYSVRFKQTLA